jgi:hypothetical protein
VLPNPRTQCCVCHAVKCAGEMPKAMMDVGVLLRSLGLTCAQEDQIVRDQVEVAGCVAFPIHLADSAPEIAPR